MWNIGICNHPRSWRLILRNTRKMWGILLPEWFKCIWEDNVKDSTIEGYAVLRKCFTFINSLDHKIESKAQVAFPDLCTITMVLRDKWSINQGLEPRDGPPSFIFYKENEGQDFERLDGVVLPMETFLLGNSSFKHALLKLKLVRNWECSLIEINGK